jgi:CRISPR/Cas system-associated exonuclease Cas4 (RecB family)
MLFDDMLKLKELMKMSNNYPIPYISYSQINTYLRCPQDFWLTYLSGGFTPSSNKYTELGSLLHEIFENQGRQLISESQYTKQQAIKLFNQKFFKIDKAHFTDKEDWLKMYHKGIQAIENYYSIYSDDKPLFVEKKFFGEIAEGLPPAKSFIDRIDGDESDPSTWIITDYKTGSSAKSKEYLRTDIQLGFYASQVFAKYGAYPKALQFFHPVPNKFQTAIHQGNGVYKFKNQRNPVVEFSVADTIMTIREVVRKIVIEQDFHKSPESFKCKLCSHYQDGTCKPFDKVQQGWADI